MIKTWVLGSSMVDGNQAYDVNGHDERGSTVTVIRVIGWNAKKFAEDYKEYIIQVAKDDEDEAEEAEDIAKIEERAGGPSTSWEDAKREFEKQDDVEVNEKVPEKKTVKKSAKQKSKK